MLSFGVVVLSVVVVVVVESDFFFAAPWSEDVEVLVESVLVVVFLCFLLFVVVPALAVS